MEKKKKRQKKKKKEKNEQRIWSQEMEQGRKEETNVITQHKIIRTTNFTIFPYLLLLGNFKSTTPHTRNKSKERKRKAKQSKAKQSKATQ